MSKVLIVDDEPHIRLLLERTLDELTDFGVDLLRASNGAEALALIEQHAPDLVLLDVMMPEMNGYEVCRRVKDNPAFTDVRIILLTAKGQVYDRTRGYESGADLYMTKPFDPDDVLERAAGFLGVELD